MAVSLFEHNKTAYEYAVRMLAERGKATIIHPTGTGKSFIHKSFIAPSGIKLTGWQADQERKYRQGKLTSEKIEKLQSIGIEFK